MDKTINYSLGTDSFQGWLSTPNVSSKSPQAAVMVLPTWIGCDEFAKQKARELTQEGYVSFVADLYGSGTVASSPEEAGALMMPLFLDRAHLQARLLASLEALREQSGVDPSRVAVIGFCFGGLGAIELLRSGAGIRAAVSFHGVLGSQLNGQAAVTVPRSEVIQGSLLVLHGYHDPLVSSQDILNLQQEMSEAHVDWQFYTYGTAGHSFMNPGSHDRASGHYFDPTTAARAWDAMRVFLSNSL